MTEPYSPGQKGNRAYSAEGQQRAKSNMEGLCDITVRGGRIYQDELG